jgi:hypothetical protein
LRRCEHGDDFPVSAIAPLCKVGAADDQAYGAVEKKECEFGVESGATRANGGPHFETEGARPTAVTSGFGQDYSRIEFEKVFFKCDACGPTAVVPCS